MIQKVFLSIMAAALISSCGMQKQNEQLSAENEELKSQLEISRQSAKTLEEVGTLLDNIDESRNALRLNMESGTSYDDYATRLNDLNEYIVETEKKLSTLESALEKSQGAGNAYTGTINRLKADLKNKTEEIAMLQEQVEKYKVENENLVSTVNLQEAELMDKESQILAKREELSLLEARIQQIMTQSQMTEADQYYARGQAIEEAANRTKLAPKKKKETYKEALEMYEKSKALGRDDVQEKIDELQKKI
ncbi:MAG: hypothetical protein ACFCUU_11460 [Cyclobacteriaceae bacterium]